ncbi:MAG TPA: hypothetical protein VL360_04885 [Gammaproteobacteria bacterium]|nr:hypothetical protein [Gammaproteobacteria bacterium]
MFAKRARAANKNVISTVNNNIFLDTVIKTITTASAKGQPIHAADILLELMTNYIKTSKQTVMGVLPKHFFTHVKECEQCVELMGKQPDEAALKAAIDYLNESLKKSKIRPEGHFSMLLSTFFALFPENMSLCSDDLRISIKKLDLWKHALGKWCAEFMIDHRAGAGSNQHELLERLSNSIPEQLTETYADFLLGQLSPAENRQEFAKGIYKGWVYSALGRLVPKLSIAKQNIICEKLWNGLRSRPHDFRIIGVCDALLNTNASKEQRKEIADVIYDFILDNLNALSILQESHQPATVLLYIIKAFKTLKLLQEHLNLERRNGLIIPMTESREYLYRFRDSILILQTWLPAENKLKILDSIRIHDNFLDIAPLFWHWFEYDKNNHTDWAMKHQYDSRLNTERSELLGIFNNDDPIAQQVKFLVTDQSTKQETREDIIENLFEVLQDYNENGMGSDARKELHQALVNIKDWAEACERINIAKLLLSGTDPKSGDSESLRASSACAAAEYAELFTPEQAATFKINTLPLLDSTAAQKAAEALEILASKRPNDDIPELMTYLLTKKNVHAKLLMAGLYKQYNSANDKILENTARMAV